MRKRALAVLAVCLLLFAALPAARAHADSAQEGLLVVVGVDSAGEKVTENYWNGFAVEGPDGQLYVMTGYYCYQDGVNVSAADYYAFNDKASALCTPEAADEDGLFCLLRAENSDGLTPIPMAEAATLSSGDAVTVLGFDWSKKFNTVADLLGSYETTVSGAQETGGYTVFTLADAAPSGDWESAVVLSSRGAVGMLLATEDMKQFFPMDYVLAYLGYETGGDTSGGSGGSDGSGSSSGEGSVPSGGAAAGGGSAPQIIFGIAIVLVAAALVFGITSYRKRRAFSARELVEPLATPETAPRLALRCTGGEFAGMCVPLEGQVAIGRAPSCQLVYSAGAQGVSATHCVLRPLGVGAELTDLGSSCGTFVNGARVAPNTPVSLREGDSFTLGAPENSFLLTRQGAM
jgi:hypothetical protein